LNSLSVKIILLVFLPALLCSQSRTGISAFYVPEKNNLPIGFTSFDAQTRLLTKEKFSLDYGLRFIGATTGSRGGYFAFGYYSDFVLSASEKFQPGVNLAFLAGGGSAAPDGDGWMVQTNVYVQYQFENNFLIKGGINYAFVSHGAIKGFSPLLALSWKLKTVGYSDSLNRRRFGWSSVYAEAGRGRQKGESLSFIGAGARLKAGRFFSGDLVIHTITNRHGGYMQILGSGGPDIRSGAFHFIPSIMLGLGGGGGIDTQGGGLLGVQAGLCYENRRFYGGVKYQHLKAWSELFDYEGIFVSVGQRLSDGEPVISWDFITKAYIGEEGFGNIGARFTAFEYRKLRLMGSTYWAFTHGKGAYAEGLFETSLSAPGKIPLYIIGSAGAGAGSGINQRKAALMFGGGLGLASPFEKFPVNFEVAYWEGGNIPHWGAALSYRLGRR
jgi:hypothetical protein